eukprot:3200862-Pyramimonas_sp.AAC.1
MALAFMQAQNNCGTWRSIRGPAGAVVMTLKRFGWKATSWDCWYTECGAKLDLHDMGPAALKKVVNQATQRRLLCEAPNSRGMEGPTGPP